MDTEELLPIDILAYITEELQDRYRLAKNDSDSLKKLFEVFLERLGSDASLNKLKTLKVDLKKDLDWFNVKHPLSMQDLKGKVVILDFFTYCCINCMHVLPELAKLEKKFTVESGLVVIGIHSPKFENEQSGVNISSAIQRYDIQHAVVNDPNSTLWRSVGIRCWPSLLVLSPDGLPMLLLMGEGHGQFLEQFLDVAIKYFENQNKLKHSSLSIFQQTKPSPASNLRFPSKIAVFSNKRYAVADAGNNRILIVNTNGKVQYKVGGNEAGFVDGSLCEARFNRPQGITFLDDDVLFVADTENHALRKITLSKNLVETLAGTGEQGNDRVGGRIGTLQPLSSPWDVAIFRTRDMDMSFHLDEQNVPEKPIVLISMAGTHQIWGYFPEGIIWWKFRKFEPRCCVALIGNGVEENRNNSYPQNAAFAQPSGIAIAKDLLFIADSESSSIRKASMVDGKVMPVVGGDRNPLNLFAFGDIDGKQFNAKLQHPLGVSYDSINDKVYVADTYNHKIKIIDPSTNFISTLVIKDEAGSIVHFNEPAGVCVDTNVGNLFVADTNNHELYKVDIDSLVAHRITLSFSAVTGVTETDAANQRKNDKLQLRKSIPLIPNEYLNINFKLKLNEDLKFTEGAPQKWTLKSLNPKLRAKQSSGNLCDNMFSLQISRETDEVPHFTNNTINAAEIYLVLSLCDAHSCLLKNISISLLEDEKVKSSDIEICINKRNISIQ